MALNFSSEAAGGIKTALPQRFDRAKIRATALGRENRRRQSRANLEQQGWHPHTGKFWRRAAAFW